MAAPAKSLAQTVATINSDMTNHVAERSLIASIGNRVADPDRMTPGGAIPKG
jgi:hypothetical protein